MALHQQVRLSIADAAWSTKATLQDTTLVTAAPLRHDADAQLLTSASLHRLFRMGATVVRYLLFICLDIYLSHFTLCIAQNASLHGLFRMGENDYLDDNL